MPSVDNKKKNNGKFLGDTGSKLEVRMLNQRVSNRDLVLISMNPLVCSLNSTDTQMKFSRPFYPTVYSPKGKVDVELSHDIAENLEQISFWDHAMANSLDAFNYGRGITELSWGKDPNSGYINYLAAARRPTDTFIKPKDDKIISTALRWKGLYYDQEGQLNFDQTITNGTNSGKIISLNPKQIFSLGVLGARFPDESIAEYLISFLDLAQYALNLVYVVLTDQINPKEILISEEMPGDNTILEKYLEGHNGIERVPLPANMSAQHPRFYDRQDIIAFWQMATRELYKIVFPISALSEGGQNASALLDNTSSMAKQSIFFSYIQSGRIKICREVNKVGNNWLDLNGYFKQGYRFELIPAPIEPKDLEIENKIMTAARSTGDVSQKEYRNWINSSVAGIRLEEEFDEADLGPRVQPKVDKSISDKMKKFQDGEDPEIMRDEVEERVLKK